jgi:hypothetical protein
LPLPLLQVLRLLTPTPSASDASSQGRAPHLLPHLRLLQGLALAALRRPALRGR